MKLRVKLSLMTGGVLLLATVLCIGLSFSMSRRALLLEANRSAYAQSQAAFQGFENYCAHLTGGAGVQAAAYWLKSQDDEYTILLREGEVCYNRTVLDPAELTENSPPRSGPQEAGLYRGRRLLVYRFDRDAYFVFIHLVDVTDTYFSLYRLAAGQGLLSALILAAAAAAVFYMLRRALRPLQALSDSANAIAAGAYDRRAPEEGKDELSGLGRDFNRMAAAVEEHIRRVEESEEQKTMFMASLTHELKTPLTAVSGYAQTLRYAKLSEEIDVGDCPGTWPCDRDLMVQALVNLVDNGVKACSEGGRVRIYMKDGALVVEDDGCGIPEGDIAHLTEAFYMVDKSRSRQSGGAGMGLALTSVILRRHGLGLRIESRLGQGTRAIIGHK